MPSVSPLTFAGTSSGVCQKALPGPYEKSMTLAVGIPAWMSGTWSSVSFSPTPDGKYAACGDFSV